MAVVSRLLDTETNRQCLTIPQARAYTELSGVYLAQLVRENTLEGFKIDHDWFVYLDSLDNFLAQKRKSGPRGPLKKRSKVS